MKRIQRKNWFEPLPANTVLVARPSRWGNPFKVKDYGLDKCLQLYEIWLDKKLVDNPKFLEPLIGKDLVCYCKLTDRCHADILLAKVQKGELKE